MLKETKTIADSGLVDRIFIGAIWKQGLEEREDIDDKRTVWRIRLKTAAFPENTFWKMIKYIEWALKIFIKFKNERVSLVNCHNLACLPIGIFFKVFFKFLCLLIEIVDKNISIDSTADKALGTIIKLSRDYP